MIYIYQRERLLNRTYENNNSYHFETAHNSRSTLPIRSNNKKLLIVNLKDLHFSITEVEASFSLFLAPFVVLHGVSDDGTFVVSEGNLESIFSTLSVEVHVDSLSFRDSTNVKSLSRGDLSDGGVWNGEVGSTVVEDTEGGQISGDGDMVDSFQAHSLFEGSELDSVTVDDELSVVDSDTDVELLVGLVRGRDSLLVFSPVAVLEDVVDDFSGENTFSKSDAQMKRHVSIVSTSLVEVEVDSFWVGVDDTQGMDGLSFLEGLGDSGLEGESVVLFSNVHFILFFTSLFGTRVGWGDTGVIIRSGVSEGQAQESKKND